MGAPMGKLSLRRSSQVEREEQSRCRAVEHRLVGRTHPGHASNRLPGRLPEAHERAHALVST